MPVEGLTKGENGGILKAERDFRVTDAVNSGDISLNLNPEKQNPHIYGSKDYDPAQNKSYFTVSLEELQKILNESYGTGTVIAYPNGQIKEILEVGKAIGVVISPTGENLGNTEKIKIHYSKGRTHIVPMGGKD